MERIYTKRLDQIRDKRKKDEPNAQRNPDSAKQVYLIRGVLSGHAPTDVTYQRSVKNDCFALRAASCGLAFVFPDSRESGKTIIFNGSSPARHAGSAPQIDPNPDRPEDESNSSGAVNGRCIVALHGDLFGLMDI